MARTSNRTQAQFVGPVAPVVAGAPVAPVVAGAPTYTLGTKAQTVRTQATLQGAHLKAGKAWRAAGYTAPNTRAAVVAVLADLAAPFTVAQACAALAPLHAAKQLGSGTPNSYVKAFIANGYLQATA